MYTQKSKCIVAAGTHIIEWLQSNVTKAYKIIKIATTTIATITTKLYKSQFRL